MLTGGDVLHGRPTLTGGVARTCTVITVIIAIAETGLLITPTNATRIQTTVVIGGTCTTARSCGTSPHTDIRIDRDETCNKNA